MSALLPLPRLPSPPLRPPVFLFLNTPILVEEGSILIHILLLLIKKLLLIKILLAPLLKPSTMNDAQGNRHTEAPNKGTKEMTKKENLIDFRVIHGC